MGEVGQKEHNIQSLERNDRRVQRFLVFSVEQGRGPEASVVHSLYIMKVWEKLREGSRTGSWDMRAIGAFRQERDVTR